MLFTRSKPQSTQEEPCAEAEKAFSRLVDYYYKAINKAPKQTRVWREEVVFDLTKMFYRLDYMYFGNDLHISAAQVFVRRDLHEYDCDLDLRFSSIIAKDFAIDKCSPIRYLRPGDLRALNESVPVTVGNHPDYESRHDFEKVYPRYTLCRTKAPINETHKFLEGSICGKFKKNGDCFYFANKTDAAVFKINFPN